MVQGTTYTWPPAGLYGRANTMRREGTAPKTMGIADDLPNRFALEHLNALAGMASKVRTEERNVRVGKHGSVDCGL